MGAAFNCGIQEERPHVERDEQVPELWRPKEQILKLTCHVVPKGTRPHMVKLRPGEELHDFHVTRKLRTGDTEEFIDRFGVMHSFEFPMWAKKGDVLKIKITVPVVAEGESEEPHNIYDTMGAAGAPIKINFSEPIAGASQPAPGAPPAPSTPPAVASPSPPSYEDSRHDTSHVPVVAQKIAIASGTENIPRAKADHEDVKIAEATVA